MKTNYVAAGIAIGAFLSLTMAQAAIVTVPGTSDPWLAGMPSGSTASEGDVALDQSPVFAGNVTPGSIMRFSATGGVAFDPSQPLYGPDGQFDLPGDHSTYSENGISSLYAPMNALLGVFLNNFQPNPSLTPSGLYFDSNFDPVSLDYLTLSPKLQQVFFIGDGLTSLGVRQQIVVPSGATRLFLGTMDGNGWYNNIGSFDVTVNPVPEPSTYLAGLCALGMLGMAAWRNRN